MTDVKTISVIGAGTWGMALARMLSNSGYTVKVWSALPEEIEQLSTTRRQKNLPDMIIPDDIVFSSDLSEVCLPDSLFLFAVPSVFVRDTAKKVRPFVKEGAIIADVAKGIEPVTLMSMSEVIHQEIPCATVVALSGPTHAEEVARDLPTTIVSACADQQAAELVQKVFSNSRMRVYTNSDIQGVELCGALKNIIALAAGISAGLGYGDNTKAAIITRGLHEMARLGIRMGCNPDTFSGLAGMGDLIVTATSQHSRNNRCGFMIGQGIPVEEAVKKTGMVVEGINALPAAMALSEKYDTEMPITAGVNAIIREGKSPAQEVEDLMSRQMKTELPRPIFKA